MTELKAVGVKDLKNNLSAYLREVRRGVRILVTDRQTVVAELREPDLGGTAAGEPMIQLAGLGRIRLPAGPKRPVPESPVHLPAGTSRRILDELRRDEGDRDP